MIGRLPVITNRMLHEEAAGMPLDISFFVQSGINPDEDIARWECTRIAPLSLDLFSCKRGKGQSVATVHGNTCWWTWDEDGIGGENAGEEWNVDMSICEAFKAAVRQGFLP